MSGIVFIVPIDLRDRFGQGRTETAPDRRSHPRHHLSGARRSRALPRIAQGTATASLAGAHYARNSMVAPTDL
jgi:hypothetical protein